MWRNPYLLLLLCWLLTLIGLVLIVLGQGDSVTCSNTYPC